MASAWILRTLPSQHRDSIRPSYITTLYVCFTRPFLCVKEGSPSDVMRPPVIVTRSNSGRPTATLKVLAEVLTAHLAPQASYQALCWATD